MSLKKYFFEIRGKILLLKAEWCIRTQVACTYTLLFACCFGPFGLCLYFIKMTIVKTFVAPYPVTAG